MNGQHASAPASQERPPRLARYASTKRAMRAQPNEELPPLPNGAHQSQPGAETEAPQPAAQDAIQRSMSRYRKTRPKVETPPDVPPPPITQTPKSPEAAGARKEARPVTAIVQQLQVSKERATWEKVNAVAEEAERREREARRARKEATRSSTAPPATATRSSTMPPMPTIKQDAEPKDSLHRSRTTGPLANQQVNVAPLPTAKATKPSRYAQAKSNHEQYRQQNVMPPPVPQAATPLEQPWPQALQQKASDSELRKSLSNPRSRKSSSARPKHDSQFPAPPPQPISPNKLPHREKSLKQPAIMSSSEDAQRLLKFEAERQRRMQAKIHAEKERQQRKRAEAELQIKRQQQKEQEEKQEAEKKEQQRKDEERRLREEEENQKTAEREARRQSMEQVERLHRQKSLHKQRVHRMNSSRHRKEEHSGRDERNRIGALASLEGKPIDVVAETFIKPAGTISSVAKAPLDLLKRKKEESSSNEKRAGGQKRSDEPKSPPKTAPAAPQIPAGPDAPVSAVNAGERRVLVSCNSASILLPVTPTTTPKDLVRSASTCLVEPIDPAYSVLLETFDKVGVQRPLRNYEHIRDVLNSWDEDRQNSLAIVPAPRGRDGARLDTDLDAVSFEDKEQPEEYSCWMHYSQKPGKWEKRWITLRSDGQVTLSKHAMPPTTQLTINDKKDISNVCHMSDFDVYTPSPDRLLKKIKPPKKHCFAVKSQQKSAMFISTENFVHFFCTPDKELAAEWYKAVQGWRSWYLVNVMGEGATKKKKTAAAADTNGTEGEGLLGAHIRSISKDSHYQLGSFQPLLDLSIFSTDAGGGDENETEARGRSNTHSHSRSRSQSRPGHKPSTSKAAINAGGLPPSSFPKHLMSSSIDAPQLFPPPKPDPDEVAKEADLATFAPKGLLGRSYSQRQRELGKKKDDGPFTEGPSLLNGARQAKTASKDRDSDGLARALSTRRGGPKPLLDFSSSAAPTSAAEARRAAAIDGGPLVDGAVSRDYMPPEIEAAGRLEPGSLLAGVEESERKAKRDMYWSGVNIGLNGVKAPVVDREKEGKIIKIGIGEAA